MLFRRLRTSFLRLLQMHPDPFFIEFIRLRKDERMERES